MKRILMIVVLLFLVVVANGQFSTKLKEYKASNGVTYKKGDTIKLNKGSNYNGSFNYVTMGGWAVSSNPEANKLPSTNTGLLCTIKKIKKFDTKRMKKVIFVVGGGNITNYWIYIEDAIAACEVTPCNEKNSKKTEDKYDKLKKIKELLDMGALTQKEFDYEKSKILGRKTRVFSK